ncbi:hypothetical protein DY000_02023651 [Brassica cretica]|uniref:DUF1232 domain-containing protein n=1 Tax=Brassica cretica TaxID=69181 RepID=A0ABQ7E7T8_BRACR|nr:hypothetical protein DY000_02023651 [Brassica cretica]
MNQPPENEVCSICHGNFSAPCQANCSHWFCGTISNPCTLSNLRDDPTVSEVLSDVQTYNRVFGGQSTGLSQRIQDLPFLLRRLLREIMDPQRTLPLVIKARVYIALILSVIYIISPIDIIPEALFGIIGLLDDVIIALIFLLHVAALYRSVLYSRHGGSAS